MAYDEALASRIRRVFGDDPRITERKMFGGLVFLLDGKMLCGVIHDDFMVRVGPAAHQAALARPHVRVMDFTGRPSNNMIYVGPGGTRTPRAIAPWVTRATAFVTELAADPKRKPRKPRPRRPIARRR